MDFTTNEEQTAVVDLADRIVADHTSPDRLRDLDGQEVSYDVELWRALAEAGLVGIGMAERHGGGGYGLVEACLVAEAVGKGPGLVPVADVVAAGRALGRAEDAASAALATAVAAGERVVIPALREGPTAEETARPDVVATEAGGSWRLAGVKRLVPGGTAASSYLVSARDGGIPALFVAEAGAGVEFEESTSTGGMKLRTLSFDDTPAARVATSGDAGGLAPLLEDLRLLRCAQISGVAAGALALAAEHGKHREQFGSPIGSFQAVAHRLADAWFDVNIMQSTYRQAAWRTDNGLPAEQATASATLWACEGGQRVVHAAQHIHGGIGVDLDYPVHRFFRAAKEIELALGGGSAAATDLGRLVATEPLTIG